MKTFVEVLALIITTVVTYGTVITIWMFPYICLGFFIKWLFF